MNMSSIANHLNFVFKNRHGLKGGLRNSLFYAISLDIYGVIY